MIKQLLTVFGFDMMWRIMQLLEDVIHLGWNILFDLHNSLQPRIAKKLVSNNLSSLELLNIIIVLPVAKLNQVLYYVCMSWKNIKFPTFTLSVINLVYTGEKICISSGEQTNRQNINVKKDKYYNILEKSEYQCLETKAPSSQTPPPPTKNHGLKVRDLLNVQWPKD